jgi:hypothetical protein
LKTNKQYSEYITQYIKENLDEIKIRVPKGEKDRWKAYAEKRDESLNSLIIRMINRTIMDDELKCYPTFTAKKKGGSNMNIDFRDSNGKLYSKDILDVALDMEVAKSKKGGYVVNLNSHYVYDETFETEEDAEEQLKHLANVRNHLESNLRNDL